MSSPSIRYTNRCSSVMRRDQAPANRWRSGSGFPMPLVGSRSDLVQQPVEALEHVAICPLPVPVVGPGFGREAQPHPRSRSWTSRCPDLASARLSRRCLALAGTRSR